MASVNTEKTFDAESIRDTSNHNGDIVNNFDYQVKTIIIENGLNQETTFQCQGSAHSDFSNSFNIGTSWAVAANTNSYQSCTTFFPFMRLTAICGSAPTTGALTVFFIQYHEG